jgi:hypothetical protein
VRFVTPLSYLSRLRARGDPPRSGGG